MKAINEELGKKIISQGINNNEPTLPDAIPKANYAFPPFEPLENQTLNFRTVNKEIIDGRERTIEVANLPHDGTPDAIIIVTTTIVQGQPFVGTQIVNGKKIMTNPEGQLVILDKNSLM